MVLFAFEFDLCGGPLFCYWYGGWSLSNLRKKRVTEVRDIHFEFMQKENDKLRKKKDELREEEEFKIFQSADGSLYEGRICRREIPAEVHFGMLAGSLFSSQRGQQPAEMQLHTVPLQHGKGLLKDAGGMVYDGNWSEGAMCGEGVLRFPSGGTYRGTVYGNEFHGTGRYTWPDGSYYEGQWENNKMHGFGKYVDAQGDRWVGKFYLGRGVDLLAEIHL